LAWEIGPEIGLTFWDLTPEQFALAADAYRRTQYDEWYRTAWMVCYLLKPWSKKDLKPESFIGPRPGIAPMDGDPWA
jgi:hypothetical protein